MQLVICKRLTSSRYFMHAGPASLYEMMNQYFPMVNADKAADRKSPISKRASILLCKPFTTSSTIQNTSVLPLFCIPVEIRYALEPLHLYVHNIYIST